MKTGEFYLIRSKLTREFYIYRVGEDCPLWTEFPLLGRRYSSVAEAAREAVLMGLTSVAEVVFFRLCEGADLRDERVSCPTVD